MPLVKLKLKSGGLWPGSCELLTRVITKDNFNGASVTSMNIFSGIHQPSTSKIVIPSAPPTMFSLDPSHWMNRCIFECKICSLRFDSRAKLKGHVQGKLTYFLV